MAETLDKLREVATDCQTKGDAFNAIGAHRVIGAIGVKLIEQAQGKRMTLDVNVRSQEDLADWNAFSPATRQLLEAAFDAAEQERPAALRAGSR